MFQDNVYPLSSCGDHAWTDRANAQLIASGRKCHIVKLQPLEAGQVLPS